MSRRYRNLSTRKDLRYWMKSNTQGGEMVQRMYSNLDVESDSEKHKAELISNSRPTSVEK